MQHIKYQVQGFKVGENGNVTASSILLTDDLVTDGVIANFGFFQNKLSVGGTQEVSKCNHKFKWFYIGNQNFLDEEGFITASGGTWWMDNRR